MFRRRRIKVLLGVLFTFQAAVCLVIMTVSDAWYRSRSSADDDTTNDTASLNTFLLEYEQYCRSQLTRATASMVSSRLCPCLPDTLGK